MEQSVHQSENTKQRVLTRIKAYDKLNSIMESW